MSRPIDAKLNELLDLAAALLLDPALERDRAAVLRGRIADLLPGIRQGEFQMVDNLVDRLGTLCDADMSGRPARGALAYVTGAAWEAKSMLTELLARRATNWARPEFCERGI